ncbi:Methyltransferase [Gracilaria domingensis]|nr:Methyltransferase [Gracilaria domingensis]
MSQSAMSQSAMSHAAFLPPSPLPHRPAAAIRPRSQRRPRRPAPSANTAAPVPPPPPPSTRAPSPSFKDLADAPNWTGTTPVSRIVNFLINFPPVKLLLNFGARRVLISTAERSGVNWRGEVAALNAAFPERSSQRQCALDAVVDPQLEYPAYYTKPFHAYPEGNLGWLPAFEARSATLSMAKRVFEDVPPQDAAARLRAPFFESIQANALRDWLLTPQFNVVDAGCGVGMSTRDLTSRIIAARGPSLPLPNVKAIDASPYFLAVAKRFQTEHDQSSLPSSTAPVEYLHALAENTAFESGAFDLWTMQLVAHELPDVATTAVVREAFRVLRSGGVFAIMDQDPRSETIRNLPPALATLLKSTEPHTDQYYFLDIAQVISDAGFVQVTSERTTQRHRCFIAIKP